MMSTARKVTEIEAELSKYKKEITRLEEARDQVLMKCGLLDTILDGLPHPFFIFDAKTRLVKIANPAILQGRESKNLTCHSLTHHRDTPCGTTEHPCPLEIIKTTMKPCVVEHLHFDPDGVPIYVEVYAFPVFDDNGDITEIIEYTIDITRRKEAEEKLSHMATHDSLTDLPNRNLLKIRLESEMAHARRNKEKIVLMLLDLDGFKEVNDTYGHLAGDALLKTVADSFRKIVRESDTVARIGGDEFLFMLPGLHSEQYTDVTVQKIFAVFAKPLAIDGHQLSVHASIGTVLFPDDANDIESLIRYADVAMYAAKQQGGCSCRYYRNLS